MSATGASGKAAKSETPVAEIDTPKGRLNWEDLRVFGAAARAGSLRRASFWLNIGIPTISRRIEALEQALGRKLFDRTPQGLVLTKPGRKMATGADSMEMVLHEARAHLATSRDVDGEVRLLMSEGPADKWFVPYFLRLFGHKFPRSTLYLGTSTEAGETEIPAFDVQIQYAPATRAGAHTVRVGTLHFLFFAAQSYLDRFGMPKSTEEFSEHRFADATPTIHSSRGFMSTYSNIDTCGRASLLSNSGLVIANAVQAGAVIGLLPSYVFATTPDYIPVLPSIHYETGIYLNFSAAAAERAEVRQLIDFLKSSVFNKRKLPWFSDNYEPPNETWRDTLSAHLKSLWLENPGDRQ